jgi:hypothetical protein
MNIRSTVDKYSKRLNVSYARYLKFKRADRYRDPSDITFAEKHSRRVAFLKRSIKRAVILLTLVIIIWPMINKLLGSSSKIEFQSETAEKSVEKPVEKKNNASPVMVRPEFFGNDDSGQPYSIKADSGVSKSENKTVLDNIIADMALKDGSRIKLSSVHGDYANKDKELVLNEGVVIITESGYELKTNSAFVTLKENMATGSEAVHITGKLGNIESKGFTIRNSGDEIELFGGVDLNTQPKKNENVVNPTAEQK